MKVLGTLVFLLSFLPMQSFADDVAAPLEVSVEAKEYVKNLPGRFVTISENNMGGVVLTSSTRYGGSKALKSDGLYELASAFCGPTTIRLDYPYSIKQIACTIKSQGL